MTEPSIEELQKELADLRATTEAQTAQIEKLTSENKETSENLAKARNLNAELLLRTPVDKITGTQSEENEDTLDSIVEEVVSKTNEDYLKRFKNAY